jgi:dienelactone hydrolase
MRRWLDQRTNNRSRKADRIWASSPRVTTGDCNFSGTTVFLARQDCPLATRVLEMKQSLLCCVAVLATAASAIAQKSQFTEREVSFDSSGVTLSGTVVVPAKPVAAVVIVHGSGQDPRGRAFARELADNDVAALTYDKRGVGRSGGTYAGPEVGTNNVDASNLRLLAEDASAGVDELVRSLPQSYPAVGLIGFSQAGWIIPLTANLNPRVRFIVLFSGPVVSTREQLRFQDLTQQDAAFWDHHTPPEVRNRIVTGPDRLALTDTDPRNSLQLLFVPGLWLFGGKDVNVPVHLSIERLQPFIARGRPFSYRVFPQMAHRLDEREALPFAIQWIKKSARDGDKTAPELAFERTVERYGPPRGEEAP